MDLLIVGAGDMGRWFGEAVDASVAFADIDPDAATQAAEVVGGRAVGIDTDERFDAVCIAVPITATEAAIAEHASNATDAVLDLSGVMIAPVAAMADHAPDHERVSLHPLFAPENAPDRIAVVADAPGPITDGILETLTARGNVLFETTPEVHDRAMETVQAKAHTAVLAFALAADEVPEEFGTPVFDKLEELVGEVTGGTPRIYADIQAAFDGADDVADAAARIADADSETFERLYRQAGE